MSYNNTEKEEKNSRFDLSLVIYKIVVFEGQSCRGQNTDLVRGGEEFLSVALENLEMHKWRIWKKVIDLSLQFGNSSWLRLLIVTHKFSFIFLFLKLSLATWFLA